jgi:hypothetical protein
MRNHDAPTDGSWRELARRIKEERDPRKILELAQQLIARFDQENPQTNPPAKVPSRQISPVQSAKSVRAIAELERK